MNEKELYPLDDVHLDELLQHVDDSKGDELHLATGKHFANRFSRFGGIVKEIDAYEKLRAPVLKLMLEDVFTDEQIRQLERDSKLDFFYRTANEALRFEAKISQEEAGMAAVFVLLS